MLFKQTMNGMARHTDCIFCELYSSLDKVIMKRIWDCVGMQLVLILDKRIKKGKFQKV